MLNDLRLHGSRWYMILPMCLVVLLYSSCSKSANSTTSLSPKTVDAEALFRGILFAEGQYANIVPELKQQKDGLEVSMAEEATIENVQNEIVANVKKINPRFFAFFKEKMLSGNRTDISSTLDETRKIVYQAVQLNSGVPNQLLDDKFLMKVRNLLPDNVQVSDLREIINSKKDEIKTLIAQQIAPTQAASSSTTTTTTTTSPLVNGDAANANVNLNYTVNLNVAANSVAFFVAVAIVITLGAVFVAVLAADSFDQATEGLSYPGKANDILLKEQIVNSIANSLYTNNR